MFSKSASWLQAHRGVVRLAFTNKRELEASSEEAKSGSWRVRQTEREDIGG